MLTPEQVTHYHTRGYVVVPQALADADLDPVCDGFTEWIDDEAKALASAGKLPHDFADEPFETRLARICAHDFSIYERVDLMECRLRPVFDFLRNEHLLDIIEPFVGPEIVCSPIQHSRAKLPASLEHHLPDGSEEERKRWRQHVNENVAPWHQDAQVHLETADPVPILTVWVPLVDATPENGCIQLIPDIPQTGIVHWGEGFGISDDDLPDGDLVTLPMQRGDVLLMHKLTPHRSTPNTTDAIRWSLDLRYQATGTPTGREFYPDFIVRSRRDPDSVYDDYDDWCQRWERALADNPPASRPRRQSRPMQPEPMRVDG